MAFVIIGPRARVAIEDADEPLLWDLPRRYDLSTPRCDALWDRFYASPRLTTDEVAGLCEELGLLRAAHARARGAALTKERKISSRDEAVRARILEQLLGDDPVLRKCDEVMALCREALAAGVGLSCSSD